MQIRLATLDDVNALHRLEQRHSHEELSANGPVQQGQVFSKTELETLISQHWIVVAEYEQHIIGYVMAGSWAFFETWPIYTKVVKQLSSCGINKQKSCQYGPIWIDKNYRGQGIFELLVAKLSTYVKSHFDFMCTFIAEENQRSYSAHTNKAGMQVVDYFSFHGRDYYLLSLDLTAGYER